MKKVFRPFLLLLLFTTLWIGCRPDDPPMPDTPSIQIYDGNDNEIQFKSFEAWIVGEVVNIKAVTSKGQNLYVFISPVAGLIGKHTMNAKTNWVSWVDESNPEKYLSVNRQNPSESGFVSIDKWNKNDKLVSISLSLKLVSADGKESIALKGVFSNQSFNDQSPYEKNIFSCKVEGRAQKVDRLVVEHNDQEFYLWVLDGSTDQFVSLNFPYQLDAGAFVIKPFDNTVRGECKINQTPYLASSGFMTVEYYDPERKELKGVFGFTGDDSDFNEAKVTEGSFFVQYK